MCSNIKAICCGEKYLCSGVATPQKFQNFTLISFWLKFRKITFSLKNQRLVDFAIFLQVRAIFFFQTVDTYHHKTHSCLQMIYYKGHFHTNKGWVGQGHNAWMLDKRPMHESGTWCNLNLFFGRNVLLIFKTKVLTCKTNFRLILQYIYFAVLCLTSSCIHSS